MISFIDSIALEPQIDFSVLGVGFLSEKTLSTNPLFTHDLRIERHEWDKFTASKVSFPTFDQLVQAMRLDASACGVAETSCASLSQTLSTQDLRLLASQRKRHQQEEKFIKDVGEPARIIFIEPFREMYPDRLSQEAYLMAVMDDGSFWVLNQDPTGEVTWTALEQEEGADLEVHLMKRALDGLNAQYTSTKKITSTVGAIFKQSPEHTIPPYIPFDARLGTIPFTHGGNPLSLVAYHPKGPLGSQFPITQNPNGCVSAAIAKSLGKDSKTMAELYRLMKEAPWNPLKNGRVNVMELVRGHLPGVKVEPLLTTQDVSQALKERAGVIVLMRDYFNWHMARVSSLELGENGSARFRVFDTIIGAEAGPFVIQETDWPPHLDPLGDAALEPQAKPFYLFKVSEGG